MIWFGNLFAFCDLHVTRWHLRRQPPPSEWWRDEWPRYYDRAGFPIPSDGELDATLVWARMHERASLDYRIVASDDLPDGSRLSTVWLGLDHGFLGRPLIFETMRFSGDVKELSASIGAVPYHPTQDFPDPFGEEGDTTEQLRYSTEEEALAAHHAIVRAIRIREGNA